MIEIYDTGLSYKTTLDNAFDIGYEQHLNKLWKASFSMPANDEANQYCKNFFHVEIYDGDKYIGLFRIMPSKIKRSSDGKTITYNCEHVMSLLIDSLLFRRHQKTNWTVRQHLEYVLSHQEPEPKLQWQLGRCDFEDLVYSFKWENENVYNAVMSILEPFGDQCIITWDTTTQPFTLNIERLSTKAEARIRYGYNMQGITKKTDPRKVVTRLYCLGYGEGVNQLGIEDVNGGLPYLEAEQSIIDQVGVVKDTFIDRQYEDANTLKQVGQRILNAAKMPPVTYTVDGADLYRITKIPIDRFKAGTIVEVHDEELDINISARVVSVRKSDILGNPGDVSIEIANASEDLGSIIQKLNRDNRIQKTYAQGATSIDSMQMNENCDSQNPAVFRFFIPNEAEYVNKVIVSYESDNFRGYMKGAKTAGAIVTSTKAGGGSTQTSSSGGGVSKSTASGGGTQTTSAFSNPNVFVYSSTWLPLTNPTMENHFHAVEITDQLNHQHTVDIPSHTHNFSVPDHSHSVTIPSHDHEIDIPGHSHEPIYGIYSGPKATSMTLSVDGNNVPNAGLSENNLDILNFLEKDSNGMITRGKFHEVSFSPNDLSRVNANIVIQLFCQSKGGGKY